MYYYMVAIKCRADFIITDKGDTTLDFISPPCLSLHVDGKREKGDARAGSIICVDASGLILDSVYIYKLMTVFSFLFSIAMGFIIIGSFRGNFIQIKT